MEISTSPDGRVYVRWHGGGPYTVLDQDGSVTTESSLPGSTEWLEAGRHRDGFHEGFDEGWKAQRARIQDGVRGRQRNGKPKKASA